MVRVKRAPIGIEVDTVNCKMAAIGDPVEFALKLIEVKEIELAGWVPDVAITPENTPADAVGSVSVCTVTQLVHPAVAAPIVRPLKVMVKAIFAPILAPPVVMMMRVGAGTDGVAHMPDTDDARKVGMAV